ncbi:hypothetical protein PINS_up019294 [Pythium insidiosum]|nr:hypothetical protein PINS_up019294 [Pythium insidiosum]
MNMDSLDSFLGPVVAGKVNWTQLPLDGGDATSERSSEDANGSESRAGRGRGRGRGPRSGRGGYQGDRRPYYDSNGVYYNGVYVPNPDPKVTAQWAKSQMYVVISAGHSLPVVLKSLCV